MGISRRVFVSGLLAASAAGTTGCAARFGSRSSYLSQFLEARNHNPVFHWLDVMLQQVRDQRVPPPRAAYNLAMPMVAGFLAANGIDRKYNQDFGIGDGPQGADPEVAYAAALVTAAGETFRTPFVIEYNEFLRNYPAGEAKSLGVEWGRAVGRQIVRMRVDDGAEPSEVNYYLGRYHARQDALRWLPTGPFYSARPGPAFPTFSRGLFPGHGMIKPWSMSHSSQFRARNFYDPSSPEFAEEFEKIRVLGGEHSSVRTEDQSEIALFWEDGPWGITPPGHFLYIGMQVLQDRGLSFIELARAFTLMAMTQCDASICAWDNKYHHDIVRPESAIRVRAPQFNNPDPRIAADPAWRSYIPTPEFPAYTSGHSTFGAAGTKMIELINGSDRINLDGRSPDGVLWPKLKGVTRTWTSLSQIAEENGLSRLYGGVHWELDHLEAMKSGYAIAEQAHVTLFRPRSG